MTANVSGRAPSEVTLVALLYLHAGRGAEYERFESTASRVMSRHGGRIERRIKLSGDAAAPASAGPAPPDEVHIVSFPDAASFARYRADPEIRALADLRAAAIRDTVVWQGSEGPAFAHEQEPSHD
jgi:uncharacterized protein (DUF1330 family)